MTHPMAEPWVNWQSMETAPQDGTHVLVSCEGDVFEAAFHRDHDGWWLANTDPTDYWDGQIWPDVWAPLPAPPKT